MPRKAKAQKVVKPSSSQQSVSAPAPAKPKKEHKVRRHLAGLKAGSLEMAMYLEKLSKQFLTPGMDSGTDLVVAPASAPQQVCVRHLHKELDITSALQPNGFKVVMRPDLQNPGFVTSPVTLFVPAGGPGPLDGNGTLIGLTDGSDIDEGVARFVDNTLVEILSEVTPIVDSLAVQHFGFNINTVGPCAISLSLIKRSLSPANVNVWCKIPAGPWVLVITLPTTQSKEVSFSGGILPNSDAIAFSVFGNTDSFSARFALGLSSAQVQSAGVNSYAPAFETFGIDNNITSYRVLSMGCLLQNTSPDLLNGGSINTGRVPYDFVPFGPNTVDALSSLPTNRRYQGKAKDGSNITWMPSQYTEFEPDSVSAKTQALAVAEYLFAEVDGWGGGASVSSFKVHFDWIVEFYTPNQIFEKVLTPPRTPEFDVLFNVMLMMPAATCNPEHEEGYKRFLNKVLDTAGKGLSFYKEHADTINALAQGLMSMI